MIRVVGDVFKAQQAVTDDDLTALDFRWMAELEQYGYWELTTAPRFAHDGPIDALQMPVPDFTLLMSWAKLRLIDGHRKGTLVAARREVRHLAWLTLTTENLVGAMVGLALLGIEERARQIFAPEQPPAVSGREAARRAVWALFMLHHEGLSTDAVERAVATARGSVLLCVTLSESAISEPYARGLLYDHYEQAYAARDRLVSDPPPLCRMTLGRRARIIAAVDVLDEGAARMYDAITPDGVVANLADAIFLRPVRHLAGLLILTTDVPDGYQRYRDLEDARARE